MDYYDKMIDINKKNIDFITKDLESCQKELASLKRETELIKDDIEINQFEIDNLDIILKDYNEAPKKIKIIKNASKIYSIMITVLASAVIFTGLKLNVAINILFSILSGLCSFTLMNGWSKATTRYFYEVRKKYNLSDLEQSLDNKEKEKTHLLMLKKNYENSVDLFQEKFERLEQLLEEKSKDLRILENYDKLAQESVEQKYDKTKKLTKEK